MLRQCFLNFHMRKNYILPNMFTNIQIYGPPCEFIKSQVRPCNLHFNKHPGTFDADGLPFIL